MFKFVANSTLTQDDLNYMREILKKFNASSGGEDSEEIMLMGDNVLDAINENELDYCLTNEGSKVIEKIAGFAGEDKFTDFATKILDNMENHEKLLSDNRSLYALEALVRVLTIRSINIKTNTDGPDAKRMKRATNVLDYNLTFDKSDEHQKFCENSVTKFTKIILSKVDEMMFDKNASHLVRSSIEALAGLVKVSKGNRDHFVNLKQEHASREAFKIPEEWLEILRQFTTHISSSMKSTPDFTHNETASLVSQSLVQSLKNVENDFNDTTIADFVKSAMKKSYKLKKVKELDDLKLTLQSASSVRLFEELLSICDEEMLKEIYTRYLSPHLMMFCKSPDLNFTIQKFITSEALNKETFEEIFDNLSENIGEIIAKGHTGVIVAISKTCEKLKSKQGQFMQSLCVALDCANKKAELFIYPLITLKSADSKEVHLHGSVIVQNMLKFQKPIKLVQNMLEMKSFELANIFCDPKGSRIADVFMESKSIGEKNREKLVKHIEGNYLKLALSKNGAFVLEKFFASSSVLQKEIIVKELSEKMNQLKSSTSGRILIHKFAIENYTRNAAQWKSKVNDE